MPPAVPNEPPATSAPSNATSVSTAPFVPLPRPDHVLPFQRAIFATPTPSASLNCPATTRPVPSTNRALTPTEPALFSTPEPGPCSPDHATPSQRAMCLTRVLPATRNRPPTMRSPLYTASASTLGDTPPPGRPSTPGGSP